MTADERRPLAAVAIPSEHGGWSLTLEPVLLGLLVAPSGAGVALGAVALLAFLARTPLKLALGDLWRRRVLPRTRLAGRLLVGYAGLVAVLVWVAVTTASAPFWQPLALAVAPAGAQVVYDARSRSRRLLPELLGTVAVAAFGAAIALAGGASLGVAAAVWLVASARAVAAIPFVRFQVLRIKGRAGTPAGSDGAQVASTAMVVAGRLLGPLPLAAAAVVVALAALNTVLARRPPPRVAVLGAQQAVAGLTLVLIAGLALRAP